MDGQSQYWSHLLTRPTLFDLFSFFIWGLKSVTHYSQVVFFSIFLHHSSPSLALSPQPPQLVASPECVVSSRAVRACQSHINLSALRGGKRSRAERRRLWLACSGQLPGATWRDTVTCCVFIFERRLPRADTQLPATTCLLLLLLLERRFCLAPSIIFFPSP